ncbi:MAG: AsmA family protein [Gammaproteobacteria bacterium]
MRIAKWVAAILGGLVLLAVLTVLTVTVFVDANRYRGQIENRVTRLTGQPFKITGDLRISWWPWLALTAGPSQFGKVEGPNAQPIVRWQTARVGARLVPLLKGQLQVDTIRLEGANVYLVRHADGTTNWEPVLTAFRNKPAASEPEQPPGEEVPPGPEVSGFQLRQGALTYVDERPESSRTVAVSNWDLDIGEWRAGSTFPVETQLALAVGKSGRAESVKISTRLHLSDDANDIDLFGLDFSGQIHGGTLPAAGLPVEFEVSRMAVRVSPLDVAISELSSRIQNVRLTTSVQAGETGEDKAFYVRGPIDLQVPSVRDALKLFGIKASLPLDKGTFGSLQAKSMLEWQAGAINATSIDVTLDETHFTGELSRTADTKPLWTFTLHGDKIKLDRYMPLEEKSKQPFELPVRALRALQARGELTFEQASMGETQMHGVRMRFELADGKLRTASK